MNRNAQSLLTCSQTPWLPEPGESTELRVDSSFLCVYICDKGYWLDKVRIRRITTYTQIKIMFMWSLKISLKCCFITFSVYTCAHLHTCVCVCVCDIGIHIIVEVGGQFSSLLQPCVGTKLRLSDLVASAVNHRAFSGLRMSCYAVFQSGWPLKTETTDTDD